LLGRLPEADEEQFELRLLSDPAFGEEFDTIVDEITDDYLDNQLPDDERERVKKYFLSTAERQSKLEFAGELLRRAESNRGNKKVPEKDSHPTFFEQVAASLRRPYFAQAALALVLIVVAGLTYSLVTTDRSQKYLPLDITASSSNRAEGPAPATVKLPPGDGLKINLTIPEDARGAKDYEVTLLGEYVNKTLTIDQRTEQTLTVTVSSEALTPRGSYAIQLTKTRPDGTKERVPDSYLLRVE